MQLGDQMLQQCHWWFFFTIFIILLKQWKRLGVIAARHSPLSSESSRTALMELVSGSKASAVPRASPGLPKQRHVCRTLSYLQRLEYQLQKWKETEKPRDKAARKQQIRVRTTQGAQFKRKLKQRNFCTYVLSGKGLNSTGKGTNQLESLCHQKAKTLAWQRRRN